jgi:AcrR family transcriptional regulator
MIKQMLYHDMPARSRNVPIDKEIAREKLILAGERLIAQQGLEGLSLRKVNLAAGQKNTSAALYHFGDKQGLLLAIFDYRLEHVDQRRHALLDDDESTVSALMRAWILPDIEEITEAEGGSFHARFLGVVANHPDFSFADLWGRPHASSFTRVINGLKQMLPELPEQIVSMRFGMAMMQSIGAMADQERQPTISTQLFTCHLIDVMTAIFTAPLSTDTRRELKRSNR